jgi:hypothetical protein
MEPQKHPTQFVLFVIAIIACVGASKKSTATGQPMSSINP